MLWVRKQIPVLSSLQLHLPCAWGQCPHFIETRICACCLLLLSTSLLCPQPPFFLNACPLPPLQGCTAFFSFKCKDAVTCKGALEPHINRDWECVSLKYCVSFCPFNALLEDIRWNGPLIWCTDILSFLWLSSSVQPSLHWCTTYLNKPNCILCHAVSPVVHS